MKRLLPLIAIFALAGCSVMTNNNNDNPYEEWPFYSRYLNTGSPLDARIQQLLDALRDNPRSATLHNELGQLLVAKGFPNDAEREFERAINEEGDFYPAWYNLGLVRASRDDYTGAKRAFRRTQRLKKGHPEALFHLGLIEEKNGDNEQAIAYYAKAIRHNRAILDVKFNPLVLDSKLIPLALLENYGREHARAGAAFEGTPRGYTAPRTEAPSPQAPADEIVSPAPPLTDPATQTPPPKPPGR